MATGNIMQAQTRHREADSQAVQVTIDRATGGHREARASDTILKTSRKGSIRSPITQYAGQPHTALSFNDPESVTM